MSRQVLVDYDELVALSKSTTTLIGIVFKEVGSLADDPQAVTYAQVKAADFGHPMTEGQITAVLVAAELGARLAAEGEQT